MRKKTIFFVWESPTGEYQPYARENPIKKYKIKKEVFEWLNIDKLDDSEKIQKYMGKLTGAMSVPRVFIWGQFVGGGDVSSS